MSRPRPNAIPQPCLQCHVYTNKLLFCSAACRRARQKQQSSLHDAEILALYAKGHTHAQIGHILVLSPQFVGRALRRNNVKPKRFARNQKRSPLSLMERKSVKAARSSRHARKRRMENLIAARAGMMFGF